jgi:hypothetical protein
MTIDISNQTLDFSMSSNYIGFNDLISNFNTSIHSIVNKKNIFYFICFLVVYFIFYSVLTYSTKSSDLLLSRTIDSILLVVFILGCSLYLYFSTQQEKEDLFENSIIWTEKLYKDPNNILSSFLIILLFYVTLFICQVPMTTETKPISISLIESKLWILLISIIFIDIIDYLFDIKLVDIIFETIKKLWDTSILPEITKINNEVEIPIEIEKPVINPKEKNEVFNISNNLYTYDDAQAICKSYNARLAKYEEVEESYNDGGEWCNYGWSDSQMILFPTQKATWDKLQQTKDKKNDCGRPGINGGFIANPNIEFGVNCFGVKPDAKKNDVTLMESKNNQNIPKSKEDIVLDAKVKFWKENSEKLLTVSSFNGNKWNEF